MKSGLQLAIAVVSVASMAAPVPAAESGTARLQTNLVEIRGGQFTYEELSICHFNLPSGPSKEFQIRSRAKAPRKGVLSRDRFVALVTMTEYTLALGMAEQAIGLQPGAQALDALDCDPLDEPIGSVDVEVNTTMTGEGMQVEVTSTATGKVSRWTRTWDEMYE